MYDFINAGIFKTREQWIHPERCIDSNELIFIIKGKVYLKEEQTEYELLPGECLVLERGRFHAGFRESMGAEFYWVHFRKPSYVKKVHSRGGNIRILLRQLLHYANTPSYPKKACELILELIKLELEVENSRCASEKNPLCAEVFDWVRANANTKLSVKMTAQEFGYNPDYLCRIFKDSYGIPLQEYIAEQRCAYIKGLLLSGMCTMSEAALLSGFENYQQFQKFFCYHENMSPTEFKNTYYATHINNR